MSKPSVLVACSSEWASPARLPRVLKHAGARVTVLSAPRHPLARTRFADEVVAAPLPLDAYVDALERHLSRRQHDAVLVTDDPLLAALAARQREAWLDGVLPIDGARPWSGALASKAAFAELGTAAGLPVPPSRACTTRAQTRAAAAALGFPLILKQSSGFAGLGVRLTRNRRELDEAWQLLSPGHRELVAQRFVDGPIGNSVFYCHRGVPVCWMSAFKVRTWPGPFGPSSARRFMSHADVAPILQRLGEVSGYHGFGALDWILDEDGRLRTIELNARPVPTVHMARLAGVDFARALRDSFAGVATVQAPPPPPDDAPVHAMFPEDVWRAASDNEPIALTSWLPRPGRYSDVPWQDPALLLYHLHNFYRVAREQRRQPNLQISRW
jgi:biotin carboxylase